MRIDTVIERITYTALSGDVGISYGKLDKRMALHRRCQPVPRIARHVRFVLIGRLDSIATHLDMDINANAR